MSDWRSRAVPVEPEPSAEEQPKSDWRSRAQAVEPSATPAQDVARERYGFDASRPQTLNRYAVLKPGAGMRDKLESAAAPYEQTARRMLRRGGTAYLGRKADAAIEGVKDASEQPGFFDEVIRFLAPGVPVGGSSRALKRGGEAFAKGYERRYDEEKVKDEAVREANPTVAGILETAGLAAPLAPIAAGLGAAGLSPLAAGGVMGAGLAGAASEATDPLSFLLDAGQGGLAGGLGAAAPWVGAGMMTVPAVAGEQMGMSPADVASARAGLATSLVSGGKAALGSAKRTKAAGKRDEAITYAQEKPRQQIELGEKKLAAARSAKREDLAQKLGEKADVLAAKADEATMSRAKTAIRKNLPETKEKALGKIDAQITDQQKLVAALEKDAVAREQWKEWEALQKAEAKAYDKWVKAGGKEPPTVLEQVKAEREKAEAKLVKKLGEVDAGLAELPLREQMKALREHQRILSFHGSARGAAKLKSEKAEAGREFVEEIHDDSSTRVYEDVADNPPGKVAAEYAAKERAKLEAEKAALEAKRAKINERPIEEVVAERENPILGVDKTKAYEWQKARGRAVPALEQFDPAVLYPPVGAAPEKPAPVPHKEVVKAERLQQQRSNIEKYGPESRLMNPDQARRRTEAALAETDKKLGIGQEYAFDPDLVAAIRKERRAGEVAKLAGTRAKDPKYLDALAERATRARTAATETKLGHLRESIRPEKIIERGRFMADEQPRPVLDTLGRIPVAGKPVGQVLDLLTKKSQLWQKPEVRAAFYDKVVEKLQTSPERWGKFQRFMNTLVLSRPGPEGLANLFFASEKDPELAAAVKEAAREAP